MKGVRDLLLQLSDSLAWVKTLRAGLGAVHDGMATVELHGIIKTLESLDGGSISAVLDPTESLHKNSRTEVLIGVPPVGRTGGRAASAKDALIHTVELLTVFFGLEELAVIKRVVGLKG